MRRLLLGMVGALVFASTVEAQEKERSQALLAQALTVSATASSSLSTKAAVPKKDKALIDIIGTVYSVGERIESECGGTPLGAPVVFINVYSTGTPLRYIGIGCAGPTFGACMSLRPGQRVRIQGTVALMPDFTRPDFDPCDPNTWFLPEVAALNVLVATKVTR